MSRQERQDSPDCPSVREGQEGQEGRISLAARLRARWPLALRSTVEAQDRALRSLAWEIERLEEAHAQVLDALDQARESRRRALSRAAAAERERDALRAPKSDRLSVLLLHRGHPSDKVPDRIDATVREVS